MNKYKKWRYERRISIVEMAKMLSISTTTLQKIEKGLDVSERMKLYVEFKFNEIIKEDK